MIKINFQVLINVKNFKLMTSGRSSFFQLRYNISNYQTNKKSIKSSGHVIPYIILTPQKQTPSIKSMNVERCRKNSVDKNSSFDVQNTQKNVSQIDLLTNSFVTRAFIVRQMDKYQPINQIVVFKGSFEIKATQFLAHLNTNQQQKNINLQQKNFLNKIYITCELFVVSSYSAEPIGQWFGFSLADQGTASLNVSFFTYNTCTSCTQITFLWTSLELVNQKQIKNLSAQQMKNIQQIIQSKFNKSYQSILKIPKSYLQKKKINPIHASFKSLNKNKSQYESLQSTIKIYNQQIHELWKRYQQYQQYCVQLLKTEIEESNQYEKQFQDDLQNYQRALNQYHWKNNIIVTEELQTDKIVKEDSQSSHFNHQEDLKQTLYLQQKLNKKMPTELAILKKDLKIDQNLVFYPFSQHQRMIKLANQDFNKIASISSLSKKYIKSKKQLINQKLSINQKTSQNQKIKTEPVHLIIFVHGYQASGFDMQNLAHFLKYKQPNKIKTYVSTSNQGRTQQPIQQLGHRLAVQIKNYLNNKFEYQNFQISFVCHSMGGIIARAALKYLQLYKNKFRTFLSLCSPHLGYLYHSSALIKTSLWVLNQVKKDPSMIQLTMQDHAELQKTFLYELSKRTQLEWFKYPIFVGSREDQYVPFWSALVQSQNFFFQTKQSKVYKMLYKNMGQKIQSKIIRLQAIFKDRINDISSFVGRTAHIRILNCVQVMQMIYLLIQKAF